MTKRRRELRIQDVADDLENLSGNMERVADKMERFKDISPALAKHSIELRGASEIALTWVDGIRKGDL